MVVAIDMARDDGTVVLFKTDGGELIAVDHRCAQDLVDRIDMEGEVLVDIEEWQVLS